jgi:hypothetical protein
MTIKRALAIVRSLAPNAFEIELTTSHADREEPRLTRVRVTAWDRTSTGDFKQLGSGYGPSIQDAVNEFRLKPDVEKEAADALEAEVESSLQAEAANV